MLRVLTMVIEALFRPCRHSAPVCIIEIDVPLVCKVGRHTIATGKPSKRGCLETCVHVLVTVVVIAGSERNGSTGERDGQHSHIRSGSRVGVRELGDSCV